AGVAYRAFLGENPPDAVSRMRQDAVPARLAALRGRASEPLIKSLEWALALDDRQRPQSVPEWRRAILGETSVPAGNCPPRAAARGRRGGPEGRGPIGGEAAVRGGNPPVVGAAPAATRSRRPEPDKPDRFRKRGTVVALFVAVAVAGVAAWLSSRPPQTAAV